MKNVVFFMGALTVLSCAFSQSTSKANPAQNGSYDLQSISISNVSEPTTINKSVIDYAATITQNDLKKLVYSLASDEFEGRKTGEKGQKLAASYIADFYKNRSILSATKDGNYMQHIPMEYFRGRSNDSAANVVAYIKGSEKPNEYIVLSAHYDHVGIKGNKVYNGADDDASGTAAVLEIAEAFKMAAENGQGPARTMVFLHVSGEEIGLFGSKYYTENPIFPLENTVANLNMDMIGRVDDQHENNPEFVYLIGSNKISNELHELSEEVNKKYVNLKLDYSYNDDNNPNRSYYRSDHYNFAKNGIPIIFYFNGVHNDYHKPTDTADKIHYDLLQKRTQLIFYTAWELANRENRLKIDE
ncbi:MAG: M28 family peptidase [Flavobacteriaceae bacterium]|nr:M28 family peptidase [Flavobacteriaceae bacterium]